MPPSAFLSLSGVDDAFVDRVHALLPDALAHFYKTSFSSGENLLEAMEKRVSEISLFVLFASKASLSSVWVKFEIDRARIAAIKNPKLQVLVFPIDKDVSYGDLPSWMQEAWMGAGGRSARDIARYIGNILIEMAASESPLREAVGRGGFVDQMIEQINISFVEHKRYPNVFIIAGHDGIGRKTVRSKLSVQGFPAIPNLKYGPEVRLPQFADSLDLYRALRQEIDENFTLSNFASDREQFERLSNSAKADEIVNIIAHYGNLGNSVTVVTGNGAFEDRGIIKSWVSDVFSAMKARPAAHLFLITNRLAHVNELKQHENVLQWQIPALTDGNIKTIILETEKYLNKNPDLPNDQVIRAIGGHAGIARTTAHLIAQSGAQALNDNMKDLYVAQDRVLSESLRFDQLSAAEKDILSILSWVPQLDASVVRAVVCELHQITREVFSDTVNALSLSCLMSVSGPIYTISGPIRSVFRRLHGYGSPELQKHLAEALRVEWDRRSSLDEFPTELFDALVYMMALEGASLPPSFQKLLTPATLQGVIKDTYDTGHDDDDAMRRVIAWGLPAQGIRANEIDETAREEILSYVVRAQTRVQDHVGAKAILDFFDRKGYRSAYYLRAFYIRHSGGDLKEAVSLLKKARNVRKYQRRVVGDLALCYLKLGWWDDLNALIDEEQDLDDDPMILDIRVGRLIAVGRFRDAEDALKKLRAHPRESGRAESRAASIIMKRDQNYREAKRMLTGLIQKNSGGRLAVRRLRAIAAAEEGDFETARHDIEFLRPRPAGADTALRIEARILLKQDRFEEAEQKLDSITSVVGADHLLRARILDDRSHDAREGLKDRESYRGRAVMLRGTYGAHSEFDTDYGE